MPDVVKDVRITVRLSKRAGARGSDLAPSAVEMRLDADTSAGIAFDSVKKPGLIGIVKGAPADLSSNGSYFDGFGEN
jgi:hypothetical protein